MSVFGLGESPIVRVLQGNYIQVGFAGFAVAYLFWQREWDRYVKIRRPTLEDAGWIVGLPLLFAAQGFVLPRCWLRSDSHIHSQGPGWKNLR
ncbi:hypothetical protein ACFQL0_19480 [Haloplanus litoreus]|uniref:hypothetical protein n=1 Tax=Haloplanus litoreus TaxID=767515 RepID=UPI00360EB198